MKKTNLTHHFLFKGFGTIFRLLLLVYVTTSSIYSQIPCDPAAEFSYDASTYCQNGPNPVLSHTTGSNGIYSYNVISGGPTLALNNLTGAINLNASNPGTYEITNSVSLGGGQGTMVITGVLDGPLTGGTPKAIEFYTLTDIPNLNLYSFSNFNNGASTPTSTFTFPNISVMAGTRIWVATEVPNFTAYFGFAPNYTSNTVNVNGDDAFGLFFSGNLIDVFGVIGVDGTGQPWEYTDGWAYRVSNTGADGSTFVLANWTFSGIDALDNTTTNASAPNPWPIGTYTSGGTTVTCTTSITIVAPPTADAGPNQLVCEGSTITLAATGTGTWSGGAGTFSNSTNPNATYTPASSEIGSIITLTWTVQSGGGGICQSAFDQVHLTILEGVDAEFSYDKAFYCPNGNNPILSHTTGTDGVYSYVVVSGGPTLALNKLTGAINLAASNRGTYQVTNSVSGCGNLVITGVIDGPVTGGLPKAVEFYALADIPDLSVYGFGSANNGGGSDGQEFTFPADAVSQGTHIWVATESAVFQSFFGFPPTYVSNIAPSVNGDDAIELFCNGVVIDVFGNINQSGTGQPWEYLDGWAYRVNNTGPDGSFFELGNWFFSGINALDGFNTNAAATLPFPINSFSSNAGTVCANDFHTQTITIDDTEAPAIACPSDIVITLGPGECEAIITFNVTATDNCDPNPEITQVDTFNLVSGDYFYYGTYTLEFEATDLLDNVSSCSFNVTINEFPNPTSTLACNNLVQASLDANGVALIGADMVLEGGPYGCYDDYIVNILDADGGLLGNEMYCNQIGTIWNIMVTDPDTGNKCWGKIKVEDKLPPVINCQNRVISCSQNVNSVPKPSVIDNCDPNPTLNLVDLVIIDNEICDDNEVKFRRTWIAFDDYENTSATCDEIITVRRPTNVNFPNDRTFNCPAFGNAGVPTGLDGLYCQYSYTFQDETVEICAGVTSVFKIIRTWTVLDWCTGQIITSGFDDINNNGIQDPGEVDEDNVQIIMKVDNVPPTINASNLTISANIQGIHPQPCRAIGLIPTPSVTDNCSGVAEIHIFTPIGEAINGIIPAPGLPIGTHTITITALDKCGNFSTKTATLTVIDDISPVTVCDEITDVNLSSDGYAEVFAETFDDGSHDNCCLDHFEVRRMEDPCNDGHNDLVFGPSVRFCCADVASSPVTVVFRAYDCYGNFNDCMVQVYVQDKVAPILVTCPQPQRILCDFYAENLETHLAALATPAEKSQFLDQFFGTPTFTDNCEVSITRNFTMNIDQCLEGTITRSWQAKDNGNNTSSTCTQTISVDHVSDWSVEFPADITVTCGNDVPDFGEPIIFKETCELVAVSYEDEIFTTVPDACYKILRTWTVINWCVVGNEIDQEVAELSEAQLWNQGVTNLSDRDINMDGFFNAAEVNSNKSHRTFRDSWNNAPGKKHKPSSADGQSFGPITDPDTDPDSDPWDGYITFQQTIKVIDTVDPVFTNGCNIPDVCIEVNTCSAAVQLPQPEITDCSIDVTVSAEIYIGGAWLSGFGPYLNVAPGTYQVKYKAIDNCNNQTDCSTTVKVKDCKKPTPYCKNGLIVTLMNSTPPMVEVWASDLDENSFDNCPGDLQFSFSQNVNDKSIIFNCDKANTVSFVNIWVTDAAGNQDFCQTSIIIEDNMGVCSSDPLIALGGLITNEANQGVQDVQVYLSGSNTNMVMTDQDGMYQFPSVTPGGDFTIVPGKDINPLNGVSTFDLVLISKHILGVQPLGSPYKIIAADANRSNSVTTFDLVEIRKLILFINDEFPNNTSWRFVKKGFVFPNPANPWQTPFPELVNMNNVPASELNVNFTGIKIGDVNGSAVPNQLLGSSDDRSTGGTLLFGTENRLVKAGETFTVPFQVGRTEVTGFQFTLNFDPAALELVEILPAIAGEENFGLSLLQQGALTASWSQPNGNSQLLDGEVFGLTFTARSSGQLSDLLQLNSRFTRAEAYNRQLELMDVALQFGHEVSTAAYELYQNTPNPFTEETVIGFRMGEAARATLTLTDISGRTVKTTSGDFAKGYNEIRLKRSDLNASGVLYYRLETENFTSTRKMILMD